jgi:hypothetical protein
MAFSQAGKLSMHTREHEAKDLQGITKKRSIKVEEK